MKVKPMDKYDLTTGGVVEKLLLVAIPTIATQFVMMSYNLVDMFLLGKVGSDAVAASGSAGMYLWLGASFMLLGRMGAEIGVAQNMGRGNVSRAQRFARNSIALSLIAGLAYAFVCMAFAPRLIGFFNIREADVAQEAIGYLRIVSIGFVFVFGLSAIVGTFNGAGNSRVSFFINLVGLLLNIALDPIFIFVLDLGVAGAAWATALSQIAAAFLAAAALLRKKDRPFRTFRFSAIPSRRYVVQILRWGLPVSAQEFLFSFFMMFLSRVIASFGAGAIAVYRVGTQIESLTWLICMGFSTALTAFIGQNYGAGLWGRVRDCYRASVSLITVWGVLITLLLYFAGGFLFSLFIKDGELVEIGIAMLKILAICQVPACLEAVASGAFRGLGNTIPPSLANIVCNGLRVPLAFFLSGTDLGLSGIWWSITIGASVRSLWVFIWFGYSRRKGIR